MDKDYMILDAETATRVNRRTYFFCKTFNLLYYLDDDASVVIAMGGIPDESVLAQRLVGRIIYYNKKLVLLPLLGKKIWILDLESKEWKSLKLENADKSTFMFFQGYLYENKIYMIGCDYPYMVVLNCDEYSLEYDNRIFLELNKKKKSGGDIYFRSDYFIENDAIITGCCSAPYFLKYTLSNCRFELIKQTGLNDYETLSKSDDEEVFMARSERRMMIKKVDGEIRIVDIPEDIELRCMAIKQRGDDIYLYTSELGDSCVYSKEGSFRKIKKNLCMSVNDGKAAITLDIDGNCSIETQDLALSKKCIINREAMIPYLRDLLDKNNLIQEGRYYLNDYLNALE